MQKVEGSSPFIRSSKAPVSGAFLFAHVARDEGDEDNARTSRASRELPDLGEASQVLDEPVPV